MSSTKSVTLTEAEFDAYLGLVDNAVRILEQKKSRKRKQRKKALRGEEIKKEALHSKAENRMSESREAQGS